MQPPKHRGGGAEFAPDGRCSAHVVAPRRARRDPTANRRSNRPRGDLRCAKIGDFCALRAHGVAGGRAPSSATPRGEARNVVPHECCARHLLPYRDPATRQRRRPRTQSRRGLGGVPQIAPDRRPTAQSVASRHARWLAITAGHCERQRGAPHRREVSRFECVIHGAVRRGREGAPQTPRSSAYLTMVWMHLWVHSPPNFLRGIAT